MTGWQNNLLVIWAESEGYLAKMNMDNVVLVQSAMAL